MSVLMVFLAIQAVIPISQIDSEAKGKVSEEPSFRVFLTNDRTHVPFAMILFVNSKIEFTDDRLRSVSKKDLAGALKVDTGAKRHTLRLIFTDPKKTSAEQIREVIEFFEGNASPKFQTSVYVQIRVK